MAIKGFQSTAQANPKATLGLGAAAGFLLGGLKGALLGGGAGALLLGLAGLKRAFTFSGEGEDPRFRGVYDWNTVIGQDDDTDASYLDQDDSTPEGLSESTWVQEGTDDTYDPGAGGMVGPGDQFTQGPELISESAEDEEGTGVWQTDDDPEAEYGEGEDDQTDAGGGGYGGGPSAGGGGGGAYPTGGSYDAPPPNVPSQGGAGGGPSTVAAPPPPNGGLAPILASSAGAIVPGGGCNPQSAADVMACLTAGSIDGDTASKLLAQFGQQAQAAAAAKQQADQMAKQRAAAGAGQAGGRGGPRLTGGGPAPTAALLSRMTTPGATQARIQAGLLARAPKTTPSIHLPTPPGSPTAGRPRQAPPPPPAVYNPVFASHAALTAAMTPTRRR